MGKYIVKRLLLLIPTTLLVCVIVFALLRMLPGDAVDALQYQLQSQGAYDVTREEVEAMLGMDKPAATVCSRVRVCWLPLAGSCRPVWSWGSLP